MPWKRTPVQSTQVMDFPAQPGFNVQQEGRSPALTLIFDSGKKANETRDLMQRVLDNSAATFSATR